MAKTILVVEDEAVRHIPVENALRLAGYDTRWTDASSLAWQYVDRSVYALRAAGTDAVWEPLPDGYSLMVLDIDEIRAEPGGPPLRAEGIRLLKKLRDDPRFTEKSLPAIGTSHHLPEDSASWKDRFLREGGNVFFEWPFSFDDLVSEVTRLIGDP